MKIIPNKIKISDLKKPFAARGTKEQLIKFENSLVKNEIKGDNDWNNLVKDLSDYMYIIVYDDGIYCYHCQSYGKRIINIDEFI